MGIPCSHHCGYYSTGQDLADHERHEHVPCPDCGAGNDLPQDHLYTYGLSHRLDCPRLDPGFTYPDAGAHP